MTLNTPIILSQKIKILKTHPCNLLFLHLLLVLIKIISLCFTSLFLHVRYLMSLYVGMILTYSSHAYAFTQWLISTFSIYMYLTV